MILQPSTSKPNKSSSVSSLKGVRLDGTSFFICLESKCFVNTYELENFYAPEPLPHFYIKEAQALYTVSVYERH